MEPVVLILFLFLITAYLTLAISYLDLKKQLRKLDERVGANFSYQDDFINTIRKKVTLLTETLGYRYEPEQAVTNNLPASFVKISKAGRPKNK